MCLALFVAYILYMASAGGDPPTAFPVWRQFVHVAPAWVLVAMTGLTSVVRHRRWRQVAAAVGLALAANAGILLVQGRGGPRPGNADYVAWLASLATPTTTISSSYGGALPFLVDAVHIDALGLNTPYIARHGTFDPEGPQDSKTDMRWVVEQRPDIIEGYLSGLALLRGADPGRDRRHAPPQDDSRDGVVAALSTRVRLRPQRAVRSHGSGCLSAPRLLGGPSTARHARLRAGRRDRARGVREPVSCTVGRCRGAGVLPDRQRGWRYASSGLCRERVSDLHGEGRRVRVRDVGQHGDDDAAVAQCRQRHHHPARQLAVDVAAVGQADAH